MTTIVEGGLVFKFEAPWQVEKYDGHPDHENGLKRLGGVPIRCDRCGGTAACDGCGKELGQGSKVVDILGRHGDAVYFIEVKDFRERGRDDNPSLRQDQKRLRSGDLAVEVALKVRDTLASLVGALHLRDTGTWKPLVEPLLRRGPPKIVLWLEEDSGSAALGRAVQDQLVLRTRWLNPHAKVMSQRSLQGLPGLSVGNLPDRVRALRSAMGGKPKEERWISFDDLCRLLALSAPSARDKVERMVRDGFLKRARSGPEGERLAPGLRWDELHAEPT